MDSWWDLGKWSGINPRLLYHNLDCAYCGQNGDYEVMASFEKAQTNGRAKLFYETLKCGNCGNFTLLLKSDGTSGVVDFKRLPFPLKVQKAPESWPEDVGRYWVQSRKCIQTESWDMAAVAIRTSLQLAVRHQGAEGKNLFSEVDDLVRKGLLPPIIKDWATEVRLLGNEGTHPKPNQTAIEKQDVLDLMKFLNFLLEFLFTLPVKIESYRERRNPGT